MMMKLHNRKPDIENLYKVLRCEAPSRPTLFEYFLNTPLYERLTGRRAPSAADHLETLKFTIDAYAAAGYDFATTYACPMEFKRTLGNRKDTFSLNEGFCITDEKSFEAYEWPEVEEQDFSLLENIKGYLPEGMKLLVRGPSGVFANATYLVGYDNLCYMLYDEPELAKAIIDNIGSRVVKYYEAAVQYESVGLIIINDDYSFNTQTLLSPTQLREYIFPWHRKIAEIGRRAGLPVILHCCGFMGDVMDDVIDMGICGKHSYEDAIIPVEQFYENWTGKIAILGGIDMDFIMRSSCEEIIARSRAMLERSATRGGYAHGTGNSVPEYIPDEKYLALISAVLDY
jgi:uroporphyrinogen decarboxylase